MNTRHARYSVAVLSLVLTGALSTPRLARADQDSEFAKGLAARFGQLQLDPSYGVVGMRDNPSTGTRFEVHDDMDRSRPFMITAKNPGKKPDKTYFIDRKGNFKSVYVTHHTADGGRVEHRSSRTDTGVVERIEHFTKRGNSVRQTLDRYFTRKRLGNGKLGRRRLKSGSRTDYDKNGNATYTKVDARTGKVSKEHSLGRGPCNQSVYSLLETTSRLRPSRLNRALVKGRIGRLLTPDRRVNQRPQTAVSDQWVRRTTVIGTRGGQPVREVRSTRVWPGQVSRHGTDGMLTVRRR